MTTGEARHPGARAVRTRSVASRRGSASWVDGSRPTPPETPAWPFKEYYSNIEHLVHMRLMFTGVHGSNAIVPYLWRSVAASLTAFVLFLVRGTRRHPVTLILGCVLLFAGVYLEQGMGLVIPGLTPDTLGEIYECFPTATEFAVAARIFAAGSLVFTLLVKIAIPIMLGPEGRPAGSGLHAPGGESGP